MEKFIIGCDPGQAGAIALLDCQSGRMEAYKMPETFPDIYELISELRENCGEDAEVIAFMENVGHGMPGQSSKATATFARHNGNIEMAFYALHIPTEMVTPQKWMKFYSNALGKSSEYDKREWKNRLKAEAQKRYPYLKITLNTADAVLIANYGFHNQ